MGIASVLTISRWMSTNALYIVSAVMLAYGIAASMLYGLMGAVAMFTFGVIGRKVVQKQLENKQSLTDVFSKKLDNRTRNVFFWIIGFEYIMDFLLLAIGASMIFYATFRLPSTVGILLFLVISLPLLFLPFIQDTEKYAIYKIGLFQSVIIVSFVYFFLSINLEDMFFGMKLYHPYLFSIQERELFPFTVAIYFIFLGKLLSDIGLWKILFRVKKRKIKQSFLLAGMIWATIPIAFAVMSFPVLYQGGFQDLYTINYDLLQLFDSTLFQLLFSITLLGTLMSTYCTRLKDLLYVLESAHLINRKKFVSSGLIPIVLLIYQGYLIVQPTILDLFFFIGIINVALLIPMLFLLFFEGKHFGPILLLTTGMSIVLGYVAYLSFEPHNSIFIPVCVSLVILGSYYLFLRLKKQDRIM